MKRLVLLLGMLLLVACNQEPLTTVPDVTPGPTETAMQPSKAESEVFEESVWLEFEFYVPCLGETLSYSGTRDDRLRIVTQPDGSQRGIFFSRFRDDLTGVGQTSGDVWVVSGPPPNAAQAEAVFVPDPGGGLETFFETVQWIVLMNENTGVVLRQSWRINLVANAKGVYIVDRFLEDCSLIHD